MAIMFPGLALAWLTAAGADEAVDEAPADHAGAPSLSSATEWLQSAPISKQAVTLPPAATRTVSSTATRARELAEAAKTLDELADAIRGFNGLQLSHTATNMVFADGVPDAPLMVVGEAPGAEEDRVGRPFVGRSGQLLDRMLSSIGFSRSPDAKQAACYITNLVSWRPPGNRAPSDAELALSLPFCLRHIALIRPRMLLLAGGVAAKALTASSEGVLRLRGRWFGIEVPGMHGPVPALVTLHPAYLLRSPGAKREAWADLLALRHHHLHAMRCSGAKS
jgi:DNA polymerase